MQGADTTCPVLPCLSSKQVEVLRPFLLAGDSSFVFETYCLDSFFSLLFLDGMRCETVEGIPPLYRVFFLSFLLVCLYVCYDIIAFLNPAKIFSVPSPDVVLEL